MMGSHQEANRSQGNNATLSGSTALLGILSFVLAIISVSVPHWGYYYFGLHAFSDHSGHFGPFLTCRYYRGSFSNCYEQTAFRPSSWMFAAGIAAILTVLASGIFVIFSILHVAMQLQRKHIWLRDFKTAIFIELIASSVSIIGCVISVGLGAWEFVIGERRGVSLMQPGVCYYIQILLIFINIALLILSYISYRKGDSVILAPSRSSNENRASNYETSTGSYPHTGGGVAVTNASASPYPHGHPRMPTQVPSNYPNNDTSGFEPATLMVPQYPQPVQPLRPIQPAAPRFYDENVNNRDFPRTNPQPVSGVSFAPGGSTRYARMAGSQGSTESLNSTQSLALSMGSNGSSASTGSGHGTLRSILQRPNAREIGSVTSESSGKQVRLSLGSEQTTV